jgi:hypothetical protein
MRSTIVLFARMLIPPLALSDPVSHRCLPRFATSTLIRGSRMRRKNASADHRGTTQDLL